MKVSMEFDGSLCWLGEEPGLTWAITGYENESQYDLLIAFALSGQVGLGRLRN